MKHKAEVPVQLGKDQVGSCFNPLSKTVYVDMGTVDCLVRGYSWDC